MNSTNVYHALEMFQIGNPVNVLRLGHASSAFIWNTTCG